MRPRLRIVLLLAICMSMTSVTLSPSLLAFPGGEPSSNQEYDCGGSCHTNPSTATMTMWVSKQNVEPGGTIDVVVNVTGGQAINILGVMIVSERSPVPGSLPSADGWVIQSDPSGSTQFNYFQTTTYAGSGSFKWTLTAPTIANSYTLYARVMHGGGEAFATDYYDPAGRIPASATVLVGTISTTAPNVVITAPTNGSTESGVVPLEVTVISNAAIKYVVVKLNGAEIANKSAGPFTWSLDSTVYKDGTYDLNVTAVDVNGNAGSKQITVTISNAAGNSILIAWVWTMAAGTVAILAWIGVLVVIVLAVRKKRIEGRLS